MMLRQWASALVIVVVLIAGSARAADKKPAEPTLRDVILRLDTLIDRIERLEQRIARLENDLFGIRGPDKHGILRDHTGRPIGIWGVDTDITIAR